MLAADWEPRWAQHGPGSGSEATQFCASLRLQWEAGGAEQAWGSPRRKGTPAPGGGLAALS